MLIDSDLNLLSKIENNLKLVCVSLPYISLLAYSVEPIIDSRVETIGVTETGKILVNPIWFKSLLLNESIFILAHELLHLAFNHHQRKNEKINHNIANIAQDYIINDILSKELSMPVPKGGLYLENASESSFEEIVLKINANQQYSSWEKTKEEKTKEGKNKEEKTLNSFEYALLKAQEKKNNKNGVKNQEKNNNKIIKISMDIISNEMEKEMFPELTHKKIKDKSKIIRDVSDKVIALHKLENVLNNKNNIVNDIGIYSGNTSYFEKLIHTNFIPPWEKALQRWFDDTLTISRSFYKASRRNYEDENIVFAGKKREGFLLNILLDTSGSMLNDMPKILGIIASFCNSNNVKNIRIIQCDNEITSDKIITSDELENYEISGLGGSNMLPAMEFLADNSEVTSLIVLTDGYIYYPQYPMPYEVLWFLSYKNLEFKPEYGQITFIYKYI